MTLDNMTGITEGSYTGFCKSQLITCNRVKECNGVCPFEDALKHADKMQTMNEQHTVEHDRDWIIGCIKHDGFIKTDRFDKANQIILDALSAEAKTKCVAQIKVDTEEVARRIKEEYDITDGWIPCSERLPEAENMYQPPKQRYLCQLEAYGERKFCVLSRLKGAISPFWDWYGVAIHDSEVTAWMPLPKPYKGGDK